jgi:hypothetical protein
MVGMFHMRDAVIHIVSFLIMSKLCLCPRRSLYLNHLVADLWMRCVILASLCVDGECKSGGERGS